MLLLRWINGHRRQNMTSSERTEDRSKSCSCRRAGRRRERERSGGDEITGGRGVIVASG